MNPLLRWLTSPEWTHVVSALLHSLWQGALLAIVLAILMRRLTNPVTRYRCALGALGVIVFAGIITWAMLNAPESSAPTANSPALVEADARPATTTSLNPSTADKVVTVGFMTPPATASHWTAWLALAWMVGTVAMLLRASIKVAGAENLRRSCTPLKDERMLTLVAEACRAVDLARKIRVAVTDKLTSPAVVGVLAPTLILPLSLFSALTPEQIRFVLLHELAHIRRGDYLANLFQLFAEALLFFNPAVWWISHQIRREREACCDALAIELSGAPADYAKTLVRVAENILQPTTNAALAFGEDGREPSSLADRVQRLLVPGYRPSLRLTWRAMLTSLLVGGALLVLSAIGTRNTVGAILTSNQPPATVNNSLPVPSPTNVTEQNEPTTSTNRDVPMEVLRGSSSSSIEVNRDIVTVTNGAVVKFNNQKLTADFVRVNHNTGDLIARGNVRFETTNSTASTDEFHGNIKTNRGNMAENSWMIHWDTTNSESINEQWFLNHSGGKSASTQSPNSQTTSEPLVTRSFEVDVNGFYAAVRKAAGLAETVPGTNLGVGFRTFFAQAGVNLDPHLGENFFFSDSRGQMWVRATQDEMDIIERLLKPLAGIPLSHGNFQIAPQTLADARSSLPPEINNILATNPAAGFRALLESFDPTDPRPKRVHYNSASGELEARATEADLQKFASALSISRVTNSVARLLASREAAPTNLVTRTFQVKPSAVTQAIESQFPQFKPITTTNFTESIRALLESSGANLSPPKSIYYNDRAGGLFVRATKEDLDTIEALLRVIGQEPPQVNIKAVFVEIPFGKAQPKELAKILGPITQANATNFTGILTAPQFKAVLRALEKSSSAKFLAMPQVTTLSGRQAQIQVTDVKTIVSGMTAVVANGTTNLLYQSQAMPFGPVLDVLPTVSGDGYTIQMTLIPTFTEFLGYEDAKKLKLSSPDDKATLPLPVFRTRQMTTSASVWDGQTIVLGNFSDEMLAAPSYLKNAPKTPPQRQSKQLLVFVTPTIVDPTGNPLHAETKTPPTSR